MKLTLFFLIAAALSLFSCAEASYELKIKIYGQGAGYTGTYSVDGEDDEEAFECNASTSDVYQYTETVTVVEGIEINIFPAATDDEDDDNDETDMTAITCRIYDETNNIVYEESYSISSTDMKSFIYNIGDEISTDS